MTQSKLLAGVIIVSLLSVILIGCASYAPAPAPVPKLTQVQKPEKDYLSSYEGLAVSTTIYHYDIAISPPPGEKYLSAFYKTFPIGSRPPNTIGSIILAPYGQKNSSIYIDLDSFNDCRAVDILVEANVPVFWRLEKPGSLSFDTNYFNEYSTETIGLSVDFGFFFENEMTEIRNEDGTNNRKYSTAIKGLAQTKSVVSLGGSPYIYFSNYSTQAVECTYSIWGGTRYSVNYINEYLDAVEEYWDTSGLSSEDIYKIVQDIMQYLDSNR